MPDPDLLGAQANDYTYESAIFELVDNAIDCPQISKVKTCHRPSAPCGRFFRAFSGTLLPVCGCRHAVGGGCHVITPPPADALQTTRGNDA